MRSTGRWVDVYLAKTDFSETPLRRVVVSSKISKKAVVRNLIKRRLRVILAEIIKKEDYSTFNISIIAKISGIEKISFAELKKDVFNIFEKIRQSIN